MSGFGGKLAFVTGAASGIGASVCRILTARGAKVIGVDQSAEGLQKLKEKDVAAVHQLDVSKKGDIESIYSKVIDQFQTSPHILVNSAGITRDTLLLKMSEEQWDQVLNVNLKGTFLTTQIHAANFIKFKHTGGAVINIASTSAKGNFGQANYSASKAGVIGLTKTSALELSRIGLRVNCILPGFIDTPMTETVPSKVIDTVKMMIPLQRTGKPDEVAQLIAFLASDDSSYMTGNAIDIDGGLKM